MTLILSLIVLLLLFVFLFLLLRLDKNSRTQELRQCAAELNLNYRPLAALSTPIRDAHFHVMDIGQFRNFRHLIEGTFKQAGKPIQLNLFDYSLVSNAGTANQTLVLIDCPLPYASFRLQQKPWLRPDAFTDPQQENFTHLQPGQLHADIRHWQVFSKRPGETTRILDDAIRQWLLAHPHLHIEWSNGILLLYRPQHVLDTSQIPAALEAGCDLARQLQLTTQG